MKPIGYTLPLGAMKFITSHTYWRQVGNDITESQRTFSTQLEVMPESTSYLKSFYCKLHLALSLPPPSLLASLYRPNRTRKSRSEGGSQAHCNVCRRIVSLWLRLQPWQLPNGPIFPYPLLPKDRHLNARGDMGGNAPEREEMRLWGEKERE